MDGVFSRRSALTVGGLLAARTLNAADEFSGADKLRSLYSAQFQFTTEGLPVVPVAIADGVGAVSLFAEGGLVLQPEGTGGPEVRAATDEAWDVTTAGAQAGTMRYWSIAWRGLADQGAAANAEVEQWKKLGERARVFELGSLFGIGGEVLDRRQLVVGVSPVRSFQDADRGAEALAKKSGVPRLRARGVLPELTDCPHGLLDAVSRRTGLKVRNEGVLWFEAAAGVPIRVEWRGGKGRKPGQGQYHGRVCVTLGRQGELAIVNAVPEDRLLSGLVPAEIFPSSPEEALKAQAVAARGELLAKIGTRHLGDPYRLCADTHCQVYAGAGRETSRTTAAVIATRGEILFTSEGRDLVDTVYSACCGGHTEHNENVWPDQPPLKSLRGHRDLLAPKDRFSQGVSAETVESFILEAPSAHCSNVKLGGTDRYRWTVNRSAAELAALVQALGVGAVKKIAVVERGISGRARSITVVGTKRSEIVRGELRIRQLFGGLRSSLFVVDIKDGAAVFRGAGFGHGVGMCQTGAVGMADLGKSYREILQHYYPDSRLKKLW